MFAVGALMQGRVAKVSRSVVNVEEVKIRTEV